jgi:hypothetical protein
MRRLPLGPTRRRSRRAGHTLLAALTAAATGCDSFDPPAVLSRPTVLAVVADPPVVAPGAAATLTLVVIGPDGLRPAAGATWQMSTTYPGVAPLGAVVGHADGTATYTAPAVVPPLPAGAPPLDSVEVDLTLEDGRPTASVKGLLIADLGHPPTANPTITAVAAGGAAVTDTLTLQAGVATPLALTLDPAPTDHTTYAWYASLGEIQAYQSNPTTITAVTAGTGWLFVAVRDGALGVAWRGVPIQAR